MADKTVSVELKAKDSLSPAFVRVGQAASTAGRQIDSASQTAAQSMGRLEQAMSRAEQASSGLGISATKVGATLGTAISGGLLLAVRAAADAEVSQKRLQTTIESTGVLFEEYASQIDAVNNKALSLSFDDEAAQDALSGMILSIGNVNEAINQMGLVEDIARGRGIDLAAASKIVIAADQERFTALKRLGIQIDENSTKESVLADLQAKYAGQAQAYANTNAGAFDRWQNSIENAAESVGAFLGPAQQLLLVFPGITAGFTGMGAAISKLGGISGIASTLAGVLSGPAGIVAAAGLAAVGIGALARYLSSDYVDATEAADKATSNFTQSLIEMGQQGTLSMLNQQIAQQGLIIGQYAKDQAEAADNTHAFIEEMQGLQATIGDPGGAINARTQEVTDNLTKAQIEFIDGIQLVNGQIVQGNEDGILSYQELQTAIDNTSVSLTNTGETAQEYAAAWNAAQADVIAIMQGTGDAGVEAQQKLLEYLKNVRVGNQQMSGFADTAARIHDEMDAATASVVANGDAVDENTASVVKWLDAGGRVHTLSDDIAKSMVSMGAASVEAGSQVADNFWDQFDLRRINSLDDTARSMASMGSISPRLSPFSNTQDLAAGDAAIASAIGSANKLKDTQAGLQRSITNAANAMTYQVGESQRLSDEMDNWRDHVADAQAAVADAFNNVQTAVNGTTKALESGFRVAVGNTDAIASQAQSVADWAAAFTDASEGISKLDSILAQNSTLTTAATINQEDYTAATEAFNDIARENAEIQQDIAVIQAKQAPIMAGLMEQQENYLQSLAEQGPAQQQFALAMMDSATATEALNLATSLLGENGDVFAPMVESAANLDPYLAAILSQMGLIEQQDDGTWTVTLDDQASSPMADLSASIHDLADQVYILTTYLDDDQANDGISRLDQQLADLDQFVATPTVNVNDNASGTLSGISALLGGLQDRTITVTTVQQTLSAVFANGGTIPQMENGGTVSAYGYSRAAKNGLTATLVGERGPEVLMLPGGAQVMNTEGSRSRWGGGAPQIVININGDVNDYDTLEKRIVGAVSEGWQRASQIHERSVR